MGSSCRIWNIIIISTVSDKYVLLFLVVLTGPKATPPSLGSPMEIILITLILITKDGGNVRTFRPGHDVLNELITDLQFMVQINERCELLI